MAELVYDHKGEWRLEMEPDGRVLVRQLGGPLYHFGHVHNAEAPTVAGWRARIPAARREALLAGFEEARTTKHESWLVPDEHGASLRVGPHTVMVVHRALETNAALDRVVSELTALASVMSAGAPSDRFPNPERELWSHVPPGERRPGLDAAEPSPGAAERAQADVDRFYATSLATLLARVAARPRPGVAPPPAPPITNTVQTFMCKATGEPAGAVGLRLTPETGGAELELVGFAPVGKVTIRVSKRDLESVHRQLTSGDARALYSLDGELVPFFCPPCNACFAASQWKIYETSPTRVEGMCPSGHRRRIRSD